MYNYSDRKSTQKFVYKKYKKFLNESILDVSADEMCIKVIYKNLNNEILY